MFVLGQMRSQFNAFIADSTGGLLALHKRTPNPGDRPQSVCVEAGQRVTTSCCQLPGIRSARVDLDMAARY